MKAIENFFKKFDIFGSPITFRLKGDSDFTSPLGGCIFLTWGGIALAYIIYCFIGFVTRDNMTLISTYKIKETPEMINFTETNLSFGLDILFENNTSALDSMSYLFDFNFTFNKIFNSTYRESIKIPLVNCTREYFSGGSNQVYDSLKFNNSLCPSKNYLDKLFILGKYGDPIFSYVQISISIKEEYLEDQYSVWDFLTSYPVKAIVYFQDTSMSYDDFNKPLDKYISSYMQYLDADQLVKTDLFYSKIEFGTDQNLFLPNMVSQYTSIFETYRSYVISKTDRKAISKINKEYLDLAKFYMRSSNKFIIYQRNYQKLPDFVANLSGILAEFLFYIGLVVNSINESLFYRYIVNKNLKFKNSKYLKIDHAVNIYREYFKNKNNSPPNSFKDRDGFLKNNKEVVSNDDVVIELKNVEKKIDNEIPQIQENLDPKIEKDINVLNQQKPLKIQTDVKSIYPTETQQININKLENSSFSKNSEIFLKKSELLWFKLCCCRFNSKDKEMKRKILKNGEDYFLNSLDIRVYLKKMQSADVLRYILLNDKQKSIYDFLSNPLILTENKDSGVYENFSTNFSIQNMTTEEEIRNVFENYNELIREKDFGFKNKALLNLFEAEMESLNLLS